MSVKSIQADQLEIQDTATDYLHTDSHAGEYSLLPGFISSYQNAQSNQRETVQLYATIDADPHDMENLSGNDIPLQRSKMGQK